MRLVCLYYGPAEMMKDDKPIYLDIPSGPGATAGFERIRVVPFLDGVIGVYCIVSDDFEFKSVEVIESKFS